MSTIEVSNDTQTDEITLTQDGCTFAPIDADAAHRVGEALVNTADMIRRRKRRPSESDQGQHQTTCSNPGTVEWQPASKVGFGHKLPESEATSNREVGTVFKFCNDNIRVIVDSKEPIIHLDVTPGGVGLSIASLFDLIQELIEVRATLQQRQAEMNGESTTEDDLIDQAKSESDTSLPPVAVFLEPKVQYLVTLRTQMDDLPLLLTKSLDAALTHIRDCDPEKAIADCVDAGFVYDASEPMKLSITIFLNGIPLKIEAVRDLD